MASDSSGGRGGVTPPVLTWAFVQLIIRLSWNMSPMLPDMFKWKFVQFKTIRRRKNKDVGAQMSDRSRKVTICLCENKGADQLLSNRIADISTFGFRYTDSTIPLLLILSPTSQAWGMLLWLYRPVCVRPGWKPSLLVFTCNGWNVLEACDGLEKNSPDQISTLFFSQSLERLLWHWKKKNRKIKVQVI